MLLVQLVGYTQYLNGGRVGEKNAPGWWRFIVLMVSHAVAVTHTRVKSQRWPLKVEANLTLQQSPEGLAAGSARGQA